MEAIQNSLSVFAYQGKQISFKRGNYIMVNATEMAKPFGSSKRAKNWLLLQSTNDFLCELSKGRNLPLADLVQVTKGGTNPGTWMHEDVALEFARWLSPQFAIWCNDRIKELLKFGITATPQAIESILADPDNAIKILTALKEERKKVALLEEQKHVYQSENSRLINLQRKQTKLLEEQAPKVEYVDNVLSSVSTYTTTQIAKELDMSANRLNKILHEKGVQFRQGGQWFLYSKYQSKGYMKNRTYTYDKDGDVGTTLFSVWTEAGRMFIHSLLGNHNTTIQQFDLKRFRESQNLTQVELAGMLGCKQNFISNIESGIKLMPKEKLAILQEKYGDLFDSSIP